MAMYKYPRSHPIPSSQITNESGSKPKSSTSSARSKQTGTICSPERTGGEEETREKKKTSQESLPVFTPCPPTPGRAPFHAVELSKKIEDNRSRGKATSVKSQFGSSYTCTSGLEVTTQTPFSNCANTIPYPTVNRVPSPTLPSFLPSRPILFTPLPFSRAGSSDSVIIKDLQRVL